MEVKCSARTLLSDALAQAQHRKSQSCSIVAVRRSWKASPRSKSACVASWLNAEALVVVSGAVSFRSMAELQPGDILSEVRCAEFSRLRTWMGHCPGVPRELDFMKLYRHAVPGCAYCLLAHRNGCITFEDSGPAAAAGL